MAADQAAGLTLKVDATQVKAANTELDKLGQKSIETEGKVKRFNDENKRTGDGGKKAAAGLNDQGKATERVGEAMTKNERIASKLGMTTRGLGTATQNAAFQIQDMVVMMEMGMPVSRTLIQQLPQLTGGFGGLGNTLRYVGAVLGPVGIGIAALTAALGVGVAITSRSERQVSELNKTLTLTGNISGLTADGILRIAENAENMGRSFNSTRDTVQALAAAGVKAGADFGQLAQVVQDFAKASDQPLEDVVDAIAKLSNDPVGGLRALADQYHVVTEAQIQNVDALVKQGRETEAVALANKTATDSFAKMSAEVKANMGTLERTMATVKKAAKDMWDAILDIGRPESSQKQEIAVREELQVLELELRRAERRLAARGRLATADMRANVKAILEERDAKVAELKSITDATKAKLEEGRAREQESKQREKENQNAKIAADYEARYATNAKKRSDALAKLKVDLDKGAISQAQYLEYEKAINEQFKDPAVPKAAAVRVDAGLKMAEAARSELAALREAGKQITANASDQTRATRAMAALNKLNADQAELVAASKVRTLTAAEKQQMAEYETTRAVREQIVEEAKRQDALEKSVKSHAQVSALLKNQDAEIKAITEGYGLSTREAANLREELQLIDRLNRMGANQPDIDAAVAKLREVQEAQRGTNATMAEGFSAGLADSLDEMGTAYSQMKDLTKFTFSAMTDAMSNFFMTGKLDAKSMVSSILGELVKLATSSAFKAVIGAFGGGAGGSGIFGSLFSAIGGAVTANANGGAYAGGNLSAFSGQIVSTPTFFNYGVSAFAKGAGLMGEAGPEAIMPLKRGADGRLGIEASGAAGGIAVATTVNMADGSATSKVSGTGDPRVAQAFGKQITEAVKSEIVRQTKPGGVLYQR